jgi:hypothetical protein
MSALVDSITAALTRARSDADREGFQRGVEEAAKVAEDKSNISMVGGSTGDAHGTARRIAAAIRALTKQESR